jgi:ubiquitin C-terminal hydrolase
MLEDFDLIRLIEQFLKEETLSDEYHCTKCKKGRRAKRCFEFIRMPNILVIHLKRFRFSGTGRYGGG